MPMQINIKINKASLSFSLKLSNILCPAPNMISKIITEIIIKLTDIK